MGRKEVVAEQIVHWFEDNKTDATIEEIAAGTGASYATTRRAVIELCERGMLQNPNTLQFRNVKYRLTGSISRMPYYKGIAGDNLPISNIWKIMTSMAKVAPDKFEPKTPRILGYTGIVRLFAAAMYASQNDNDSARQALTAARRNLIQARTAAKADLIMLEKFLGDPKLNPNNPRQMIPVLLEDENNPVDIRKMLEEMQEISKMIGNKA